MSHYPRISFSSRKSFQKLVRAIFDLHDAIVAESQMTVLAAALLANEGWAPGILLA